MVRTLLATALVIAIARPVFADLSIKNIQARHGQFGPVRTSLDLYPGDEVVFTYTVEGVKTDPAGNVSCEFELKVSDASGNVVFRDTNQPTQVLPTGVNSLPNATHFGFGLGTPPGQYKFTLVCTDKRQQLSDSFERIVNCLPVAFAIIQPRFSYDAKGETNASLIDVLGQSLFFRLSVIGFDRAHGKIDLSMRMQLIDEKGQELLPKPVSDSIVVTDAKKIAEAPVANFWDAFSCLKIGSFRVKISVTDNISHKTTTFESPIRIIHNDPGQ